MTSTTTALPLADFVATGRDVDDLDAHFPGCDLEGVAGRTYGTEPASYLIRNGEGWYLILGNEEHEGSLAELEPILYAWAVSAEVAQ